jgi:RNA polymerase subunit RPABC4/transcription elongation factor Spt4
MLFLFFGYGSKVKALGPGGERTCPRCGNTATWQRLERYRYVSFFFVRVARWHRERVEACPVCGHGEAIETLRDSRAIGRTGTGWRERAAVVE